MLTSRVVKYAFLLSEAVLAVAATWPRTALTQATNDNLYQKEFGYLFLVCLPANQRRDHGVPSELVTNRVVKTIIPPPRCLKSLEKLLFRWLRTIRPRAPWAYQCRLVDEHSRLSVVAAGIRGVLRFNCLWIIRVEFLIGSIAR